MNHKGYHQLKWEDRLAIEKMLKAGCNKKQIAEALGVCLSTVYSELKRGMCVQLTTDYEFVERYTPDIAELDYQQKLRDKGKELKIGHCINFANYLERKIIDEQYSPGVALAEAGKEDFPVTICIGTLYNYIYRGDVFYALAPEHLHLKGRRRKHSSEKPRAARSPAGTSIEERPIEVATRKVFGHWEMDSVMGIVGSKRALLVLTERCTRMGIIIPVPDHTSASVVKALDALETKLGKDFYKMFRSITVDNGCEFQNCEGMEKSVKHKNKKRTKLYYCHPHTPQEHGSNENMNGIIRRFFPKGTNFDNVSDEDIRAAEDWINNYPRKLLGWKSARELLDEYCKMTA